MKVVYKKGTESRGFLLQVLIDHLSQIEIALKGYSGAWRKLIREKNRSRKSRGTFSFSKEIGLAFPLMKRCGVTFSFFKASTIG